MQGATIGLDIGGTKITGIIMSPGGEVLAEARAASEPADYTSHLMAVGDVIDGLTSAAPDLPHDAPIGVSQAGLIRDSGDDIIAYNLPCLKGQRLRSDMAEKFSRPVTIINDATAFTLSEMQDGAATKAQRPLGIILGTGLGGGFVLRLPDGGFETSLQASWGEMAAPASTAKAPMTLADAIAGPVLERQWKDSGGDAGFNATDIAQAATSGNDLAVRLMERFWWQMALGLANAINMLGPDLIVFGGSLSAMPGLLEEMKLRIPRHTVAFQPGPTLVRAKHGPDSGVRGAAWMVRQSGQDQSA
ncbi:MAG: ROK family protein [Alphaproteobacteria bacterium]